MNSTSTLHHPSMHRGAISPVFFSFLLLLLALLLLCVAAARRSELAAAAAEAGVGAAVRRRLGSGGGAGGDGRDRRGGRRHPGHPAAGGGGHLRLLLRCPPDHHELDEAEVVQAQLHRDVPAVHVHLHLLPSDNVLGAIHQLQEVSKGSNHEVPLVQAQGRHPALQGQIPSPRHQVAIILYMFLSAGCGASMQCLLFNMAMQSHDVNAMGHQLGRRSQAKALFF